MCVIELCELVNPQGGSKTFCHTLLYIVGSYYLLLHEMYLSTTGKIDDAKMYVRIVNDICPEPRHGLDIVGLTEARIMDSGPRSLDTISSSDI